MARKQKRPIHDLLFKETYQRPEYALDIFRLVFTPKEFGLFNWKTLAPELTTYVDEEWKERAPRSCDQQKGGSNMLRKG